MAIVRRVVLDVLKPHQPNALEFASQIADLGHAYQVDLLVKEVDEKTESLEITIAAERLDFEAISRCVEAMGGAIHSIDHVQVLGGILTTGD